MVKETVLSCRERPDLDPVGRATRPAVTSSRSFRVYEESSHFKMDSSHEDHVLPQRRNPLADARRWVWWTVLSKGTPLWRARGVTVVNKGATPLHSGPKHNSMAPHDSTYTPSHT